MIPEREICGFIVRRRGGLAFVDIPNRSAAAGCFAMHEADVARALRRAAAAGEEIVALLHTHAGSATPSEEDRQGAAASRIPWIIVGGDGTTAELEAT